MSAAIPKAIVLCPTCDYDWLPDIRVIAHEDDCPTLAERRHDPGCRREDFGFCNCGVPA